MSLVNRGRRRQKPARQVLNEQEPEVELLAKVKELAEYTGWMVYHTYDSRRSDEGFPDLVLVKDRVIFAELKSEKGKLSPKQLEWIGGLRDLAGAAVCVWRPSDFDEIARVLQQ